MLIICKLRLPILSLQIWDSREFGDIMRDENETIHYSRCRYLQIVWTDYVSAGRQLRTNTRGDICDGVVEREAWQGLKEPTNNRQTGPGVIASQSTKD